MPRSLEHTRATSPLNKKRNSILFLTIGRYRWNFSRRILKFTHEHHAYPCVMLSHGKLCADSYYVNGSIGVHTLRTVLSQACITARTCRITQQRKREQAAAASRSRSLILLILATLTRKQTERGGCGGRSGRVPAML